MDGWTILGGLVGLLVTVGIIGAVLYRGIDLFFRVRPQLRGHFFAAVLWSLVTLCQTAALLLNRHSPDILNRGEGNIVGQSVVLIAGSVMVWSWAQFAERQSGATYRQERRPFLARVFVQSFWGVLALWGMAWGAGEGGNALFDRALSDRDVPMVSRLHAAGFAGNGGDYTRELRDAILAQDEQAVRAYLAADAPTYTFASDGTMITLLPMAIHRKNVAITELLFADAPAYTDVPLLQEAVQYGQVEQARFLIERGADVNEVARKTHFTALQIAKKDGNQPMIALLKAAGAVK